MKEEITRFSAEGDLYTEYRVGGHTFTIRYGYYGDMEREEDILCPILPDFWKTPLYDRQGRPLITDIQNICRHYRPGPDCTDNGWCADCLYCSNPKAKISVCTCERRKRQQVSKRE